MRIKSTILLVLFTAFLVAPSVVTLINQDADVSIFYSMNEEENKNGLEIEAEKQIKFKEHSFGGFSEILQKEKGISNFAYLMNFVSWHSETISPPPENIG